MNDQRGGFETVLEYLRAQILDGQVGPGQRLPTERELATQLGASRSAVREAIKVLQAQGVISSHTGPGGGTRVATGQGVALGQMLKLHVALDAISFTELTETRVVLERAAVEAAVQFATTADIEAVIAIAHQMDEVLDPAGFNELDTAFHVAIAGMGANRLIRDLTIAIREAVARRILAAEERSPSWLFLRDRLVQEHHDIAMALANRDAMAAASLCEEHIRGAHKALR